MATTILGIIASILALAISLFAYYTSDKTKIRQLKARQNELEEKLRIALVNNDTIAISSISLELERVRAQLSNFNSR
jgi:uncharacterized membrane protein (DUF106 family)